MAKYLIEFPAELHKEAKVRAAMQGITLKQLILKAITEYLKKGGD